MFSKIQAIRQELLKYFDDPYIKNHAQSIPFINDLKDILVTGVIPKRYNVVGNRDFYELWFDLIDTSIDAQQKETLCDDLCKKYSNGLVDILFQMPLIVTIEFLRHSSYETLHAYLKFYCESTWMEGFLSPSKHYFADLIKIVMHSACYSSENKEMFISKLLSFFRSLRESNKSKGAYKDVEQEALACWILDLSADSDKNISEFVELGIGHEIIHCLDEKFTSTLKAVREQRDVRSFRSLSSYVSTLTLKRCFNGFDPSQLDLLFSVIKEISDEKNFKKLHQIIRECGIDQNSFLINYLIITFDVEDQSHVSGLFIKGILLCFQSEFSVDEFQAFLSKFIPLITAKYYANNTWALYSINDALLAYWVTEEPQKFIEALKTGLYTENEASNDTLINRIIVGIPSKYFNDTIVQLLVALEILDLITVFSLCRDEVQGLIVPKLLEHFGPEQVIEQIRMMDGVYKGSPFATKFKKGFTTQLERFNPVLFEQIKSERLFALGQDALEQDLGSLEEILKNPDLTHDQRSIEIRSLTTLTTTLRQGKLETCEVVMKMFKKISQSLWPYLFIYFEAAIVRGGFPYDKSLLSIGHPLPPRNVTWRNHPEVWENMLFTTFLELTKLEDEYVKGTYASWALSALQHALVASRVYFPALPLKILKNFFLADIAGSMRIFGKIKRGTIYTENLCTEFLLEHTLIASWLPDDTTERFELLSNLFTKQIVDSEVQFEEAFLDEPYLRNLKEQRQFVRLIVDNCDMPLGNFLEKFSTSSQIIIMGSLSLYKNKEWVPNFSLRFFSSQEPDAETLEQEFTYEIMEQEVDEEGSFNAAASQNNS